MIPPNPLAYAAPLPKPVVMKYYRDFFSPFGDNVLFEVYDISIEAFVKFHGTESSRVMNKGTIIEILTDLSLKNSPLLPDIIILIYNDTNIDFDNPVFIGSKDTYKDE